jgi:hypothetical protein
MPTSALSPSCRPRNGMPVREGPSKRAVTVSDITTNWDRVDQSWLRIDSSSWWRLWVVWG